MTQKGVLETAWRYRRLVVLVTLIFGFGAAYLTMSRPNSYVAHATVVLQDPDVNTVLGVAESSDRVVANQLEVFRSGLAAAEAAEIASLEGFEVTESDVVRNTTFTTLRGTDVIAVAYADEDADRAVAVANSIIAAYDQVQRDQRRSDNANVLKRLDSAEALLLSDLNEVQRQISEIRATRAIGEQIEDTLNRVAAVQSRLLDENDPEARSVLTDELSDLQLQMESLRLAATIEAESGALAGLLESRDRLQPQLASIDDRRTELEIEAAVEGSGIAFFSPATSTEVTTGSGLVLSTLGGMLLGGLLALGLAYALVNWRRQFDSSTEPESILDAPFLAEIPRWSGTAKLPLPVRDDPRSTVAEAFRFASATIDIRMGNDQFKSVNFISAKTGEGKSTLVANTALASARTGKRVLLVDADFGSQASSKLLVDGWDRPGMTDLVLDKADLQSSVSVAALRDAGTLHVMGRGTQNVTAPDFFANPRLEDLMSRLESLYDLVLIDGPPLLQVAYASTIARLADALVIVVPHGSRGRHADELSKRVKLIETPVIGYLYNQGPRKAGRDTSGGSMKDILGDQGLTVAGPAERAR